MTKFSKKIENTVGNGEIACLRAISYFPTVFSKDLYCRYIKSRLVWERVNSFTTERKNYTFSLAKNTPQL